MPSTFLCWQLSVLSHSTLPSQTSMNRSFPFLLGILGTFSFLLMDLCLQKVFVDKLRKLSWSLPHLFLTLFFFVTEPWAASFGDGICLDLLWTWYLIFRSFRQIPLLPSFDFVCPTDLLILTHLSLFPVCRWLLL